MVDPTARDVARSPFRLFLQVFVRHRGAMLGLAVFAGVVLAAILADVIAPHAPDAQFRAASLQPPAWVARGSWQFPLGTDPIGRDILSRLIHGARFSLLIAVA